MRDLHVIVNNKIATYLTRDGNIVCGNSDYQIVFAFDSEWDGYGLKVARFIWNNGYRDVPFTGNTVAVPKITNTKQLEVGVYSGELSTTTPAVIDCNVSILCKHGLEEVPEPDPNIYQQILDVVNNGIIATVTPNFANSIDECTDTTKVYVLPDGYIYAYMNKTGAQFTNQLVNAIDTDGTPYNGSLGYKTGYVFDSAYNECDSSSGIAKSNSIMTGFIPYNKEVIRVCGFTNETLNNSDYIVFFNEKFEPISAQRGRIKYYVEDYALTYEEESSFSGIKRFTFDLDSFTAASSYYGKIIANEAKYVRFTLFDPDITKTFVTLGEDIVFGTDRVWQNTGHAFVPADYEDRIIPLEESAESHETRIRTLEMYGSDSTSATDIPAYIKTEADDVMNRLFGKQGNRCFTMVAISDFHYGGIGDNKDNLIRASKAISYISNRMHIDAIAALGDNLPYGSEYNETTRATADRWLKEINEILAVTQKPGIVDFRTPGNHDRFGTTEQYMPDNAIYSLISGYNRQCDYVDVPGGWAYRDFPGYNLRVIVLNTAETEGKGRFSDFSGYHMSAKQYNWLIDTLDMSSKTDATAWQILILSHHRPDDDQVGTAGNEWGANRFVLPNILHAYDTGGSYTATLLENGEVITCNFSGKNQARLIGSIHGHHHAYLYGNISLGSLNSDTKTAVMAISTPTSSFGSGEGHNDDNDGIWYDSVKDTAEETAFCVYSIDLDNHVIHAIHYGNGIDREIEY